MSGREESKVERRRSLMDRLRGIYRIPIRDGLGPVATSEEPDNPHEYVRTFPGLPPIHGEAAEEIGRLRAVIRVNWLRFGASGAELDKALYGEDDPSPVSS